MYSFIIPAHNEEALIGRTIDAIVAACAGVAGIAPSGRAAAGDVPGPAYEIIVADDASTDRTAEIARGKGVQVVQVNHRKIAATRNSGARAATGDVLVFVDADTFISGPVLAAAIAAIDRGAVGGGAAVSFDGSIPFYGRALLRVFLFAFRHLRFTGGCFLFCTRQAFDAAGGWNESVYAGEELYLCAALKKFKGRRRFVILREAVLTSGRKLRTHTVSEVLGVFVRIAIRGPKAVQTREGLDLWYAERRSDPGSS
jgi:glycosyltransferase involved in cell wall biosynthesis